jgi:hypothetical protein
VRFAAALACCCAALLAATARPAFAADAVDAALDSAAVAVALELDPRVAATLPGIDGVGRRLLALRSYLRSGERLAERWSWSEQQIAAWEGSLEQLALQAEIERVRAAFTAASPGFELFVNPQVRSIDRQLASWNDNESVAAAATNLLTEARALFEDHGSGDARSGRDRLAAWLRTHVPQPVPTVAAPGLSPHGQMRAIDFQVHRRDEIVAGPDTRTIDSVWEQGGWAGRLDAAVRAASPRFVGPLVSPREPWHYTYTPEAVANQ